jgi:mono/diheme cytochrome c family protein
VRRAIAAQAKILSALFVASLVASFIAVRALASSSVPGSSEDRSRDSRGVYRTIAQAPIASRSWKNPYAGPAQRDAILAGEKLYRRHCAECHGDDAEGLRNAPDLRAPGVQNATDGELAWFLRNGKLTKAMPPWAGIPEQRRWQIITYLKSLGPNATKN